MMHKTTFLHITLIYLIFQTSISAQILTDYPCYAVSKNNGTINNLFEYKPEINRWNLIGNTGTNYIGSIAADSENNILYTVESAAPQSNEPAIFGSIDLQTGAFNPIDTLGKGFGEVGSVQLNQIEGLAFDQANQTLYAVHKVDGIGLGTNDLLFQIDAATGAIVTGAMENLNGLPADYSVIPQVFDSSFDDDIFDVSDIAIMPNTMQNTSTAPGSLLAVHAQNGPGLLTELNKINGALEKVLLDFPEDDIESLGITNLGELYATSGDDGSTQQNRNTFIFMDINSASAITLSNISSSGADVDFESFDCFYSPLNAAPLCQAVLQLPLTIASNTYTAQKITTNKDAQNSNSPAADIKIYASKSVTLQNITVSKDCQFLVDIDLEICN